MKSLYLSRKIGSSTKALRPIQRAISVGKPAGLTETCRQETTENNAMAVQFGKTWWGEHWLRSLEHVDYDNRLPRGASYARSGHVKEVKIKGNHITAKVAGSRPRPYNVTIIVPPFFDDGFTGRTIIGCQGSPAKITAAPAETAGISPVERKIRPSRVCSLGRIALVRLASCTWRYPDFA